MKHQFSIHVLFAAALCASAASVAAEGAKSVAPHARTIGVVSISSIIPADQLVSGTNFLVRAGYRVKVAPNVPGPKVVSATERARLLEKFWLDPEIDLLVFSRGGQGAADVVPLLDWDSLRKRPNMPVVGFSDVTVLLNAMLAKGVGHPLSGPTLSYADRLTPAARDWFFSALSGAELPPINVEPLCGAIPERGIRGLPMGGHLERLYRLSRMGLMPSAAGRIVFIECTAKYPPQKVRQCLDGLLDGGFLNGAAAVVFCNFQHKGDDRAAVDAIVREFAARLGCPSFKGFPYGHVPQIRLIDFRREFAISPSGAQLTPCSISLAL